jgi:virginiamycin B lyase
VLHPTALALIVVLTAACSGNATPTANGGILPRYTGQQPTAKPGSLQIIFQFPGAPKAPFLIASDGNGREWFSECGKSTIANIDESTDTYSRLNTSYAKSCYGGIALGANHAGMWFTDPSNDKIGFVGLKDHAFHVYRGPTQGWSPATITAGPDDAMWFTETSPFEHGYYHGKIGRIDLSKRPYEITEFSLPYYGGKGEPSSIVSGSDGALWFTDSANNGIGRITTDGEISLFPLPSPWFEPNGITPGPDSALWFAGYSNTGYPYVGRIDPVSHAISSFKIGQTREATTMIVALGTDLWFTENQSAKIGCINSTTHQTHEYDLPQGSSPWGISVGMHGVLWITESLTNSLASYLPPGPCSD